MGGRDRVSLADELATFPELMDAFAPAGFALYVHRGSQITLDGDDHLRVDLAARLQPAVFQAFEQLGRTQTGPIERAFSTRHAAARHRVLRIPRAWAGLGRGRALLRQHVELYDALEINRVSLQAVNVGRYVWGMCGFDFVTERDREHVVYACQEFAEELDYHVDLSGIAHPWELGAIGSVDGDVTLREIAGARGWSVDVGSVQEERLDRPMRLGKALMLFSRYEGWEGMLDLRDGTAGRIQLMRYSESADGS